MSRRATFPSCRRRLIATAAGLVAFGACGGAADTSPTSFRADEVLERRAELIRASEARDWQAVARLYTDDAVLMPPSGRVIEGRDSITAFLTTPEGVDTRDARFIDMQVRGSDVLAYVAARYSYYVIQEGDTTRVEGPYVAVWHRHPAEGWQIQAMSWH